MTHPFWAYLIRSAHHSQTPLLGITKTITVTISYIEHLTLQGVCVSIYF